MKKPFTKGSILRESAVIALFSFALIVLIALITFDAADPGYKNIKSVGEVNNYLGVVGAFFSSFVIYLFGLASYFFPVFFLVYGLNLIDRKDHPKSDVQSAAIKFLAFVFVLLSTCCLSSMYISVSWVPQDSGAGGIIGLEINQLLSQGLGEVGTTLLSSAIWIIFMPIFIGFSWVKLIRLTGQSVINFVTTFGQLSIRAFTSLRQLISSFGEKNTIKKKEHLEETGKEPPKKISKIDPKPDKKVKEIKEGKKSIKEKQTKLFQSRTNDELPDLNLLDKASDEKIGNSKESIEAMSRLLELKLKDFGIIANVVEVLPGPIVTRFEINPAPGVKVSQISNLSKDLARSLSVSSVRVVEVIEGKSVVGIEIPNEKRELVVLGEILRSKMFADMKSPLSIALGKDIAGNPVCTDLAEMPHLLIAGTTGSGKSVGINAMVLSLLYKSTPKEIRLIMIDPKMLELSVYAGIPHLLCPVVTDMKAAANALRWCVMEMDRRYRLMASFKVRNLNGLNKKISESIEAGSPVTDPLFDLETKIQSGENPVAPDLEPLPKIVVIIDELADMMLTVGKKVEHLITRLAAKARASGIYMIIATQRPSVDVITGLIKANIPCRIAYQCSARVDSRTILDQMGAESLLGNGDMLFIPPGTSMPIRIHGAFVSDEEVRRVSENLQSTSEPIFIDEVTSGKIDGFPWVDPKGVTGGSEDSESDPLYDEAVKLVTESRNASISSVQRRLRIGYNRAARIVEHMEDVGIVGPLESNGKREVLAPPPPEA
ncbi:MAG TPA: DNA translocase FtsK [Gammaproteobacteria bacterium]|nr:DNA translocase FtsK [Gammaproteobacteria bacterium]